MDLKKYFNIDVPNEKLYSKDVPIELGEHGVTEINGEYYATTFHLKGGGRGTEPIAKGEVLLWINKDGERLIWNALDQKALENNWPKIKYVGSRAIQKYSISEIYKLFNKEQQRFQQIEEIPVRDVVFDAYPNSELNNEIELFFKNSYFSKRLQIAHIRMIIEWQFKMFLTEKFIISDKTKTAILKYSFAVLRDIFVSWQLAQVLDPLSDTFKRKRVFMNGQLQEHRELGNYFIHFSNEDTTISNLINDEDKYNVMIDEAKNTIRNLYHIYKEITNKIDFDLSELIKERKKM